MMEETGQGKEREDGKRQSILRPGRFPVWFPWQRETVWEREIRLEGGCGKELILHCIQFRRGLKERKKRRLIQAARERCGELWLSRTLAGELLEAQPSASEELLLFRLLFRMEQRKRKKNAPVQSLVVWEDNKRPGTALNFLPALVSGLNYLTVIGGREEDYAEFAETVWQEEGLPVRFLKKPVRDYPYGPELLVLNMAPGRRLPSRLFPDGTEYTDVLAGMPKFLDTIARNEYNT